MKVGEGDGGATLSLKERAEKYHKKRACDSSECPEEALGHLSSQCVVSVWTLMCGNAVSQESNAKAGRLTTH